MTVRPAAGAGLRAWEVFGTLLRCGTTVAAAEALGISQSAVSLSITDLEARLGFSLFVRDHRRLEPTEAARVLAEEVAPLFDRLALVEMRAADIRDGAAGRLRIMSTPPLGHSIVPRALRAFLAGRPQVKVHYEVARLERVIEAVAGGLTDVGLALGAPDAAAWPVDVRVLRVDPLIVLVPGDHALAGHAVIGPADMAAHRYVGLEATSPLGAAMRAAFRACGVPYAPQVEVRYCHTAAVMAEAGNGLAVVDRYTARFLPGLSLRATAFAPATDIAACLLSRPGQAPSDLAQAFAVDLALAM